MLLGGGQWQKIVLGICQVGSDHTYIEGTLRAVADFIDRLHIVQMGEEEVEVLHF